MYYFYAGECIEASADYGTPYWWCRRATEYLSDTDLLIFDSQLSPEEREVTKDTTKAERCAYHLRVQTVRLRMEGATQARLPTQQQRNLVSPLNRAATLALAREAKAKKRRPEKKALEVMKRQSRYIH